jgi:hypothetical protein
MCIPELRTCRHDVPYDLPCLECEADTERLMDALGYIPPLEVLDAHTARLEEDARVARELRLSNILEMLCQARHEIKINGRIRG